MQNDTDLIKSRLSIEEVVGQYIELEKAGSNLKGRCPFHNEKTPSFFVSPDRGSYYCFGCGAKGDIFSFVQEQKGISFREALEDLAEQSGVELKNTGFSKKTDSKLYEIMETATSFFEKNLESNDAAKKYLKDRGLTEKTISEFRVGFALDEWQSLLGALKEKGFKEEDMEKVGLIKKGQKDGYYDHFRSRLMFPIFDRQSRVVAFSGRIFGEDQKSAKYINSPETELFDKSSVLYGLHKARPAIRKHDFSILVEGQMDLLMAHQSGYSNTVATSGTAATPLQVDQLKKISKNIVVAYDADSAGVAAAEKVWKLAMSNGMDVKSALIPEGEDPAEIIKESPEKWKEIVKKSVHPIDYLLDQMKGLDLLKMKQRVIKDVLPYLSFIESAIKREHFAKKISEATGISEQAIEQDLSKVQKDEGSGSAPSQENEKEFAEEQIRNVKEYDLEILNLLEWLKERKDAKIDSSKIEALINELEPELVEKMRADFDGLSTEESFKYDHLLQDQKVLNKYVFDVLQKYVQKYIDQEKEIIQTKIRTKSEDEELLKRYQELISKEKEFVNKIGDLRNI